VSLSIADQITQRFYDWEQYGRGHILYHDPVELEPPLLPLDLSNLTNSSIDDGRVLNPLERVGKWLTSSPKEPEPLLNHVSVQTFERSSPLTGYIIHFPSQIVQQNIMLDKQWLTMLSFTNDPISFEWWISHDNIQLRCICSTVDASRVESQLHAFHPELKPVETDPLDFLVEHPENLALCDIGLEQEFMCPVRGVSEHQVDSLTSIFAIRSQLQEHERIIIQNIFRGVHKSWASYLPYAVSDGAQGSILADFKELPRVTQEKTSEPLFAYCLRIAVEGLDQDRSSYLIGQITQSIALVSDSKYNRYIPLSNEGFELSNHFHALINRVSFRLGMIVNVDELALLNHIPAPSLQIHMGASSSRPTKQVPKALTKGSLYMGQNIDGGIEQGVYLDDQARLRHMHVIGATGTGKTTFLRNLFIEDIKAGRGALFLDPHGDAAQEFLEYIPENRIDDVVYIDPSDTNYAIGFNLLEAHSEQEQMLLSSDLVGIFKREAMQWGDVMTSVLSNAINAFVESSTGGTLFELKRFLLEKKFRDEFLKTVDDPATRYYFTNEFTSIKRASLSPLLTRLDTFLRPKVLRNMFIQRKGLDFHSLIRENKIVVVKLALGMIGEKNASLLGSLIIAKINQAAFARQNQSKEVVLVWS